MKKIFLILIPIFLVSCASNSVKHEESEKKALAEITQIAEQCKNNIKTRHQKHWANCHSAGIPEKLEQFDESALKINAYLSDAQVYSCSLVFYEEERCGDKIIGHVASKIPYLAEPFSQEEKNYTDITNKLIAKKITVGNFNRLNLQLTVSGFKRIQEVQEYELAMRQARDEKEAEERNEKIANFFWRLAAASCTLSMNGCGGSNYSNSSSGSGCSCECINGQMTPVCESSIGIPPICTGLCPLAPPGIAPLNTRGVTPIGTTRCSNEQVYNSASGRYEWREVCY